MIRAINTTIIFAIFAHLFAVADVLAQGCGSAPCPVLSPPGCDCGYDDGQFTINQTINLDGCFSDWTAVLNDLDNNTCDGPIDINGPLADRDAPVQGAGRDMLHFSFTWNNSDVYLYTTRAGSGANNIENFLYYGDVDNDGLMETGEPVVLARWSGSNRTVDGYFGNYLASAPGGDPMVDGLGFADGYTLPGTITGLPSIGNPNFSGCYGSGDGLAMEFSVPWTLLGLIPGTPFTFHVSTTNSSPGSGSFPDQVDDNMAGCGGGPAGTGSVIITFVPDRSLQGDRGATEYAAHTITNNGNVSDTFDISSVISGSHTPAINYFLDADASGTFTVGDTLLTDSDGDSVPDTGLIVPGTTMEILIAYTISNNSPIDPTGIATVVTAATSTYNPAASDSVTDTVEVISPDLSSSFKSVIDINGGLPEPGDILQYTITLTESAGFGSSGVSVTDDIPAFVNNFTLMSSPPGATPNFSPPPNGANNTGLLDVTNITVPASSSVTIIFQVTISGNNGDIISNSATINNPNGPGAAPTAPNITIVVPSDLSGSNKSVIDQNGGDANPGDILRYTITIIESAGINANGVSVTDDIPNFVNNFTVISGPPGSIDNSSGTGTGANGMDFSIFRTSQWLRAL